ncbi:MAG: hypothetical protein GEU80_12320 [Dehalococcoidia bacterium]|nr:hypothetical protein [Dehalococcoidia bacterium]
MVGRPRDPRLPLPLGSFVKGAYTACGDPGLLIQRPCYFRGRSTGPAHRLGSERPMDDVQRLLTAFEDDGLVRPSFAEPHFMDLVHAVGALTRVPDARVEGHAATVAHEVGETEHLVVVLADGLGLHFVEELPPDAWLRRHLAMPLQAAFPPTTAVAITSLATGTWVTEHAAPGWWTYLPALGEASVILPFQRLKDESPLEALGFDPAEALPPLPIMPRMAYDAASVLPAAIAESTYSRWMSGAGARLPYATAEQALDRIVERIQDAPGPTYTYWYTSRVDRLAHDLGTCDARVHRAVEELDGLLDQLQTRLAPLGGRPRIVVTADHGHREVPADGRVLLQADDPILGYLRCHPTGDVRVLYFHLRPDAGRADHAAFRDAFRERFGEGFVLLSTDEVQRLRLMGPDTFSAETRRRLGDYTAISLGAEVMRYAAAPGLDRFMRQRSQHSGLSEAEMRVPLVVG